MQGETLGPYRITVELGAGGMGKVYLAEVTRDVAGLEPGSAVAIKVIHAHLLEAEGFFQRFLREADIGRSVRHENVVRTYLADALLLEGVQQNFLVMEYVEGQTLRDLLTELERVPEELCRHIGREVAQGLAAIHEAGVIHRDLKPENVLITDEHAVKIMDLGVARLQDEAIRLSQTGAFLGSVEYAAPEQFRAVKGGLDGRADLHALGVLLYELSTGRHPYRDDDLSKLLHNILDVTPRKAGEANPQLSPFFEEVVHALLAKDREERLASATELVHVLDEGEGSAWWKERAKALQDETQRPLRRIRIPRETALYGRDANLAELHSLFERAKAGDGQALLVEGEAGIGKTRLVDEFVGRLRQAGEDVNFLFGSYPPGGAATAAGAFSTAYREQFGPAGSAPYLASTPILVPAFDALLRGEPPPEGQEPLNKDSLQTVFVHATRGLAAERPTIVLVDDLHFAPEDGRALFSSLALAVPGHRVLLLGTLRPGVPDEWIADIERFEQASRTVLSRLGPKDLAHLLKDAFRSERLARELGIQIAEKSDGNPFFAFEIIRGLREGLFIAQESDGTWVTTKVIEDIQVPSSVLDLVKARVSGLSEDDRALLDVAACWGHEFDPGLVGDVLGFARIPALRAFGQIERAHRLVRANGRAMVFDHHQVQEALYDSLLEQLREEYHAALADALRARTGAAGREDPGALDGTLCVDLCEHYLRGARGDEALHYLDAALCHLGRNYLNDRAIALAEQALAVPGLLAGTARLDVLLHENDRLRLLGRRGEQERVLGEARRLAEASAEQALVARVEQEEGNLLRSLARHGEARQHYERHLALARELGDRKGEAGAMGNLGNVCYALGSYVEAQACHEARLAIATAIGDTDGVAESTGGLGDVAQALGRYEEARDLHERHLALARELGDREGEATATGSLGKVLYPLGRYEDARTHHERALTITREIGDRAGEARALGQIGNVDHALGRNPEALENYGRWLSIARETGNRAEEAQAIGNLGSVYLDMARYAEAQEHYERQLATVREVGDRQGEGNTLGNLGNVFYCRGLYEESRRCHEDHRSIAVELGNRLGEAIATGNLGIVHTGLGRYEEAREHYESAIAISRELGYRRGEARSTGNLGLVLHYLDRLVESREHHERHLELAREIGDRQSEALALTCLGATWHGLGERQRSREAFDEALAISREIGGRHGEAAVLLGLSSLARNEGEASRAHDLAMESLALRRESGYAPGAAESLIALGDLRRQAGDTEGARRDLEEALSLCEDRGRPAQVVLARAILACLPDGDVDAALQAVANAGERAVTSRVRWLLWMATRDPVHLEEAKRLVEEALARVPEAYHAGMREDRVTRDVLEAWQEREVLP